MARRRTSAGVESCRARRARRQNVRRSPPADSTAPSRPTLNAPDCSDGRAATARQWPIAESNNDVTGTGLAYKIVCRGVDGRGPVRDPDRASLDTSDECKPQQQATALFMGSVRPTKMSRARRGRDRLPRRAYRADFLRETCGLGVDGARACPWRLSCLMAGLAGCGLCFGGGFGKDDRTGSWASVWNGAIATRGAR